MRAVNCDIDHTLEYSRGGTTLRFNLGPLCHHHHQQKGEGHWLIHLEGDDTVVWTSTLTGRLRNTPEPYPVPTDDDLVE